MATVSESNANFIQGLSDLWIRFFKDKPTLEALYSGMEIPVGQAYLELLSNVLNMSVRETPIFRKEFFKLLTVREDLVTFDPSTATYKFELTNLNIRDFKFLYNKIFAPTVILEKQVDFTLEVEEPIGDIETEMGMDAETGIDYLTFSKDPFDWEGDGLPIPGVAYRTVDVAQDDGTVERERELAFWIPDAQVDAYDLYLGYGYLLNYFAPSSESYRALLQGIIQYFVLGPTTQHLTSALNVMLGLPLVRDDGEVLQSVDTSDPLYQIVKTSRANYQFGVEIPLRPDVLDTDSWGTLTFEAFEQLSDLFHVHDSVAEPTWFFDSTIPLQILPDELRARRNIYPGLWENKIDLPEGLIRVGDPGFIVGRDDDGSVPTGDRSPMRHGFAYIMFERFLRHHVFTIEFDPDAIMSGAVPFPRFTRDLLNIVIPGKSAYTYLLVEPALTVTDVLHLYSEQMSILVRVAADQALMGGVPTQLRIGDDRYPWDVGDYYVYDSSSIVVSHWPIGNRFENGKTPFILGGSSPTNRGGPIVANGGAGYFNVTSGEGYFQKTNNTIPSGPALIPADVGRYIYRPLNNTWFRITRITTFYIVGIPPRVRVTAYLDAVPNPTTSGLGPGETWKLYSTPTADQLVDWAPQIQQIGGFPTEYIWAVGELADTSALGTTLAVLHDGVHATPHYLGEKRDVSLRRVWGDAVDNFWAVGTRWPDDADLLRTEGVVYRWDGELWQHAFTMKEDSADVEGLSVWGSVDDDVWVGATGIAGLYHWDGSTWTKFPITSGDGPFQANSIWGSADDDVYAAGEAMTASVGQVWHWDGVSWSLLDLGTTGEAFYPCVFGLSASQVWVVGNWYGVYYWNGATWTQTFDCSSLPYFPYVLYGAAANNLWLGGWNDSTEIGELYHWNGSTWTLDAHTVTNPIGIWAKSTSQVYLLHEEYIAGAGWVPDIDLWNGSAWSTYWPRHYPNWQIGGIWGLV